ncbi:MAG: GntR family transcriptional regulator [Spirochaetaceae bacterium]
MAKLYEKIVNKIKESIVMGELHPNDKLPTEVDLAKEFNVSRITSKRALEELRLEGFIYRVQGSGSFVAEIKDKNRDVKTSEANDDIKRIAIIIPFDQSMGGIINVIKNASEVFHHHNYYLTIHSVQNDTEAERKLLAQLYQDGTKGIIYYPITDLRNFEIINKLFLNNYPIVAIDKYFDGIPISSVVSDNMNSCYNATEYLIKQGHKNIGFISDASIESAHSVRQRYFGYCRALKNAGIIINESFVETGFRDEIKQYGYSDCYNKKMKKLMDQKITALVCINDYVASLSMREALNLGYKVPEDLSIIGHDDIELASHLHVPLTTVAQDFCTMGRVAAELVIERIKDIGEPRQVILPTKLVIRSSSSKI